jgi:hypothetical protein
MPEWVIATASTVVGGAAGAMLAVFLIRRWDALQLRHELKRRDLALLYAFREDTITNLNRIKSLQQILYAEIPYLSRGATVVDPLPFFVAGYWDMIKMSQPSWLATDPWMLAMIRDSSETLGRLNDTIRSRESYRIANESSARYLSQITAYDKAIFDDCAALEPTLEHLLERLQVYR